MIIKTLRTVEKKTKKVVKIHDNQDKILNKLQLKISFSIIKYLVILIYILYILYNKTF